MSKPYGVLRTHTDRFNLFNDGRKLGANQRNYIISSVRAMFNAEATQELLRLGEAYGFYGHSPRERSGKLFVGETEIINVNGKSIVVENVPACRTITISVDDDGTVTHTQEVLDTPTGRIVDSLIASGVGGWSWATSGREGIGRAPSYAKTYAGMDYVLQPNYLSLDHPAMLMESVGERDALLMESLQGVGLDEESARKVLQIGDGEASSVDRVAELENEVFLLEGMISDQQEQAAELERLREDQRTKQGMMLEALNKLPIYLSDEQKRAFTEMDGDKDLKIISNMFESLGRSNLKNLPLGNTGSVTVSADRPVSNQILKNAVNFTSCRKFG